MIRCDDKVRALAGVDSEPLLNGLDPLGSWIGMAARASCDNVGAG